MGYSSLYCILASLLEASWLVIDFFENKFIMKYCGVPSQQLKITKFHRNAQQWYFYTPKWETSRLPLGVPPPPNGRRDPPTHRKYFCFFIFFNVNLGFAYVCLQSHTFVYTPNFKFQ